MWEHSDPHRCPCPWPMTPAHTALCQGPTRSEGQHQSLGVGTGGWGTVPGNHWEAGSHVSLGYMPHAPQDFTYVHILKGKVVKNIKTVIAEHLKLEWAFLNIGFCAQLQAPGAGPVCNKHISHENSGGFMAFFHFGLNTICVKNYLYQGWSYGSLLPWLQSLRRCSF